MKIKVGLVFGGKSSEHDISIRSAQSIMEHLNDEKYDVVPVGISRSGEWKMGDVLSHKRESLQTITLTEEAVWEKLRNLDVVFPILHGPNGEDGTVQGLLDTLQIPYVGCGVAASVLGIDKVYMKQIFEQAGLPQCSYLFCTKKEFEEKEEKVLKKIEKKLGYPCFVKPARLGSSVGISKAKNKEALKKAIQEAFQYGDKIIIEEFVQGRELEIGVLEKAGIVTSAIGEVLSTHDFYDYESKYQDEATRVQIPALVPKAIQKKISKLAKKAFEAIEGRGLSRVDFFWDGKERVWINEINTMPGFTTRSMYPMLFQEAGVSYEELIDVLIEGALTKR